MTVFRKQYFIHRPLIDKRRFQHYNCSMPEEKHISSNKHDFIEHNLHVRFYVRQYIGCGMRQGLVSLCFEPSQPLRVTSGLNEVGGGRGGEDGASDQWHVISHLQNHCYLWVKLFDKQLLSAFDHTFLRATSTKFLRLSF